MLFHVKVAVRRFNKDLTDVRNTSYAGFVDLQNPDGLTSAPWLMTKARTLDDQQLDDAVPMDVVVELDKKTDSFLFNPKVERSEFEVKYYSRKQKLTVIAQLSVNKLSVPRVRVKAVALANSAPYV